MHARFHVLTAIVCWAHLLRADRGWPTVATTFLHTARFAGRQGKAKARQGKARLSSRTGRRDDHGAAGTSYRDLPGRIDGGASTTAGSDYWLARCP